MTATARGAGIACAAVLALLGAGCGAARGSADGVSRMDGFSYGYVSGDYENESFEEDLAQLDRFLRDLDGELGLGVDASSIAYAWHWTDESNLEARYRLRFVMRGREVVIADDTSPWKHVTQPTDHVMCELARHLAAAGAERLLIETMDGSRPRSAEEAPTLRFLTLAEAERLRSEGRIHYAVPGTSRWLEAAR